MAAVLAASPLSAYAADAKSSGAGMSYDEAYYVTTDYYGNLINGSVVKSYVTNGDATICDYGSYDGIRNLTNAVQAKTVGTKTVFDLGSDTPQHFYFEAYTSEPYKALPWDISVRYELNGVPAKAEDIAGKTGVVEIFLDAVPNENASEYEKNNFSLASTAVFNQDDILSLEAKGAQVQLIGNLRVALFIALPGEEQHVSIRIGTDHFQFGGMTFLMTPVTLSQMSEVSKLQERKGELESDYEKLSGSLDAVLDSLDGISRDLDASANGLREIDEARRTVSEGKEAVYGDLDSLKENLVKLEGYLEPLSSDLAAGGRALSDGLDALSVLNSDMQSLKRDLKELDAYVEDLGNSAKPVSSNIQDTLTKTQTDAAKVQDDLNALDALKLDKVETLDPNTVATEIGTALTERGMDDAAEKLADPETAEVLNDTVEGINGQIEAVNGLIEEANSTVDAVHSGSDELLQRVNDAAEGAKQLQNGLKREVSNVKSGASDLSSDARTLISDCSDLYAVLEDYEPRLQNALKDMEALTDSAAEAISGACVLLDSGESLLKDAGSQFDKGAEDSLSALADTLNSTARALRKTDDIRDAKDVINGIVEDTWEEYTGKVNNLLNADANAQIRSLTDPRNPAPSSVQVLIRTQEIKAEDAAPAAQAEQTVVRTTFWQRVEQMFSDIAAFIIGIFRR